MLTTSLSIDPRVRRAPAKSRMGVLEHPRPVVVMTFQRISLHIGHRLGYRFDRRDVAIAGVQACQHVDTAVRVRPAGDIRSRGKPIGDEATYCVRQPLIGDA